MIKVYTKSNPKETRILRAFLRKSVITRTELDAIAGTVNSPEYIRRFRLRGLPIVTERFSVRTEDGIARPGRYRLLPESRELARELLEGEKSCD